MVSFSDVRKKMVDVLNILDKGECASIGDIHDNISVEYKAKAYSALQSLYRDNIIERLRYKETRVYWRIDTSRLDHRESSLLRTIKGLTLQNKGVSLKQLKSGHPHYDTSELWDAVKSLTDRGKIRVDALNDMWATDVILHKKPRTPDVLSPNVRSLATQNIVSLQDQPDCAPVSQILNTSNAVYPVPKAYVDRSPERSEVKAPTPTQQNNTYQPSMEELYTQVKLTNTLIEENLKLNVRIRELEQRLYAFKS